jgi:hypothetical protein
MLSVMTISAPESSASEPTRNLGEALRLKLAFQTTYRLLFLSTGMQWPSMCVDELQMMKNMLRKYILTSREWDHRAKSEAQATSTAQMISWRLSSQRRSGLDCSSYLLYTSKPCLVAPCPSTGKRESEKYTSAKPTNTSWPPTSCPKNVLVRSSWKKKGS